MGDGERDELNASVRAIWDANAAFWDERIGPEGNDFHRRLIVPAQRDLLALRPGERVLEVACGNGQFAREMARLGVQVLATDFSERFIELARRRTDEAGVTSVTYRVVDAADEAALLALGPQPFDAAVCTMGLMDMADIGPLARSLPQLLRPGGRFVFSVTHPCFNNPQARLVAERVEEGTEVNVQYGVRVTGYLDIPPQRGVGIAGQPAAHYYFHRPLTRLLEPFLRSGLVLDGLREPSFDAPEPDGLSWAALEQVPPIFVARLRPGG